MTPFWFVVAALVGYGLAYFGYGKWYDRQVWQPDPKRTTPAHMYMDGVEYFPVSRYVLWGYQFKSVAALGPILGPFVAISYGWLPALLWIILGNFFIGWMQDYGAIMLSVRNQGKSFGPISYEFMGNEGRSTLLGFVLFYLIIISAAFIYLISLFWNIFPATFWATVGVLVTGVITGQLLYRARMNVAAVTVIALVLIALSIVLGLHLQTKTNFLGAWTVPFWAVVCCVVLYLAAVLPLPSFIQPVNYVSFFPAFLAVILIIVGALLSPVTGVQLAQPAWKTWYTAAAGPIWPMMFVAIACGAISGWHSLVSSSTTSKQLDVEVDAHPIGAGAMLSEGLLALASLAAYMVLSPQEIVQLKSSNVGSWVFGAVRLTQPFLGGDAAKAVLTAYFGLSLVIFAITVQSLVTRFWRLVSSEVFSGGWAWLGQKHVSTFVGLLIPLVFAISGSWINLWLYFGGANQLLAGLALMLIAIHLARAHAPTAWTFWPATFMIVTTLAALLWETWYFLSHVLSGQPLANPPLDAKPYHGLALFLNGVFVVVGIALLVLGIRMAIMSYAAYNRFRQRPAPVPRPSEAAGD